MRKRIGRLAAAAIFLALTLGTVPAAMAGGYNPAARKIWSTVNVQEGVGFNVGCINGEDNPFGYYVSHGVYWGWIWIDSNGVSSPGWFADGSIGPREIVGQFHYSNCEIPARH